MSDFPFDLKAIRHNWARSISQPKPGVSARLATVETPRNVPADVKALVARIGDLAGQRFPERAATLKPFFEEATRLANELATPNPASEEDPAAQLLIVLNDLEELLDVFTIIRR